MLRLITPSTICFDFAGDGFFFFEVRKQSSKPWVSVLITPYTIFFALACAVSLTSVAIKSWLLVRKIKSRFDVHELAHKAKAKRLSIGGIAILPTLAETSSDFGTIAQLKSKFDEHRMHRRLAYCHIASALLEDVPLGRLASPSVGKLIVASGSKCGSLSECMQEP